MLSKDHPKSLAKHVDQRAEALFDGHRRAICVRMDRLFAILMVAQWFAGIVAAILISPRTWSGSISQTHVHVWAAIFLGGAITSLPVFLALRMPGRVVTRQVIAIAQMLTSALFIHLTGGRIETHFHVFGSLALLACYRDTRVLVTATLIVALDHGLRGVLWPESVYGVLTASSWRFLEHAGWVVFENLFLGVTIRQSLQEMKNISHQQAQLEVTNSTVEAEVERRTSELSLAMAETARSNRELAVAVQELEEKNAELDQFSYVASHDLQEPLRKLISFGKLLEQDIEGELNEKAQKDLFFIVDAAQRMRLLVQDLLALSRAGRTAMQSEPTPLNRCLDAALETQHLRIEETNAKIIRDPLPTVVGDNTLLTQVYENLLGNALKFVGDESPVIHLTCERADGYWILGVKDNGIGLKTEYAARIFMPFQRLHNRQEFSGTGIGLAICHKSVHRHGGRIFVESEPGCGAHFKFTLPLQGSEEQKCETNLEPEKELSYC